MLLSFFLCSVVFASGCLLHSSTPSSASNKQNTTTGRDLSRHGGDISDIGISGNRGPDRESGAGGSERNSFCGLAVAEHGSVSQAQDPPRRLSGEQHVAIVDRRVEYSTAIPHISMLFFIYRIISGNNHSFSCTSRILVGLSLPSQRLTECPRPPPPTACSIRKSRFDFWYLVIGDVQRRGFPWKAGPTVPQF